MLVHFFLQIFKPWFFYFHFLIFNLFVCPFNLRMPPLPILILSVSLLIPFRLRLISLIHFEIILLFRHFLPFWDIDRIISIVHFFLANLFEILPFLFLMLAHDVSLRRLIVLCLCDIIDEARVTCLFANIDSPHFELFTAVTIFVSFFNWLKIFGKDQIFFIWELNRSPIQAFSSFCYELMNGSFSTTEDLVSIWFYLFL